MKKFDFAIEKVFRFFNHNNYEHFQCAVIQMAILKDLIKEGEYDFNIMNNESNIFKVKLYIYPNEKKVIEKGSHEDPLIETDKHFLVCLQIPLEVAKNLSGTSIITLSSNDKIIEKGVFQNLNIVFKSHSIKNNSMIKDYTLISEKDCILRIHVGQSTGQYHEEEYILHKNTPFNFKEYIEKNAYIGLQCSYEQEKVEIEEKYIMIGQKGMVNSHVFFDGTTYYQALLPFQKKYQRLIYQDKLPQDITEYINIKEEKWEDIHSISELLNKLENKNLLFFETSLAFIIEQYKKNHTYGLYKTYSSIALKKAFHIDTEVCKNCKNNTKCLQMVPSGLSFNLLKMNVALENEKECIIFKRINNEK